MQLEVVDHSYGEITQEGKDSRPIQLAIDLEINDYKRSFMR